MEVALALLRRRDWALTQVWAGMMVAGSRREVSCTKPLADGGAYLATHNCVLSDQPVARGSCYRDTFGDLALLANA